MALRSIRSQVILPLNYKATSEMRWFYYIKTLDFQYNYAIIKA